MERSLARRETEHIDRRGTRMTVMRKMSAWVSMSTFAHGGKRVGAQEVRRKKVWGRALPVPSCTGCQIDIVNRGSGFPVVDEIWREFSLVPPYVERGKSCPLFQD